MNIQCRDSILAISFFLFVIKTTFALYTATVDWKKVPELYFQVLILGTFMEYIWNTLLEDMMFTNQVSLDPKSNGNVLVRDRKEDTWDTQRKMM